MVFNMGWRCVVCGVVCSTSSGFSSGLFFSVGVLGLRFPLCVGVCVCVYMCLCVCACACVCAWLGAFGISTGKKKHILTNVKECREGKTMWRVSLFIRWWVISTYIGSGYPFVL